MIEIPVELGARRYVISIGYGLSKVLPELLGFLAGRRLVLVSNPRVFGHHGTRVEASLRRVGPLQRALIPDGERHKSLRTLSRLHDAFLAAGLTRDGVVVALGGGVVGDAVGFAAATYMRGVDWVQIPTTLLAMVDSSVGGKVGINHPHAKNLIGAFHQPRAVVSDPAFLETLPLRQVRSGAFEALKCGVIGDRSLFEEIHRAPAGLRAWERTDIENLVASSCRIKAEIVERDEREGGLRRVLNLGHTIGHALEAVTHYRRFTHGEAVGWGMIGAAWIAHRRRLIGEGRFDTIAATVDHLGPRPKVSDLEATEILRASRRDKKVKGRSLTFVLPAGIGRCVVREDVTSAEVRTALAVMAAREARLAHHA
jgi:3-dehydroquinate synthase